MQRDAHPVTIRLMQLALFYLLITIIDLVMIIYTAAAYGRMAGRAGKSRVLWVIVSIVAFFALATGIGAGTIGLIGYLAAWVVSRGLTIAILATLANSIFPAARS
jgi:hypothetical protein